MTEQQTISTKPSRLKKFLSILLILIVVAAIAGGGYLGLNFVTAKINAAKAMAERSVVEEKLLQSELGQLQNSIQDLQNEIERSNITKTKNWKPIVIEHLVRMADLTLNTTGDTKLALSFLSAAMQYASGPELSVINHALNKDIAGLQAVPVVVTENLILKIEALNQTINALPLVTQEFTNLQEKKPEESSGAKSLWRRFFVSTVNALKEVVTIRRQTVEPLLSPEQETNLRLTIQTKLLQAEWAIMHRQNKLYQSCLERVASLITRYFVANSHAAASIIPTLQELQQVDLQPKLVFPTESIAAVINFISANKIDDGKATLRPQTPTTIQNSQVPQVPPAQQDQTSQGAKLL